MSALLMPPPGKSNAHRGAFFLEARGASDLGENFGLMTMDAVTGSFVHTRIVGTARTASTPPPRRSPVPRPSAGLNVARLRLRSNLPAERQLPPGHVPGSRDRHLGSTQHAGR